MKWLREVHIPQLYERARSAILHGNEDSPVRVEVFDSEDPDVGDSPIAIYTQDSTGKLVWNPGVAWALRLLAGHVQTVWRTDPPATIRFSIGGCTVGFEIEKRPKMAREWDSCKVNGKAVGNRCGASAALAEAFADEIKRIAKLEFATEVQDVLCWLEDEEYDSGTCDEMARRLRRIVEE